MSLAGPVPLIRTAPSLHGLDRVSPQPGGDLPDQHRVMGPLVLGVGERERQQLLLAELRQRPVERAHRLVARGHVRSASGVPGPRRGKDPDILERGRWQSQLVVPLALLRRQPLIGVVEEQQVLALDREHQHLGVVRLAGQHAGVEDRVQQEQRERCLGRDAGHAGDGDVGAAGAVDELEVDVDGLAVAAEADWDLLVAHLVEVQRRVTLLPGCPRDDGAGHRRHVHLGLDPGDGDLRDLGDLRRQRALLDQEHIGGEPRTLMHRLNVRDHTRHLHRSPVQAAARLVTTTSSSCRY